MKVEVSEAERAVEREPNFSDGQGGQVQPNGIARLQEPAEDDGHDDYGGVSEFKDALSHLLSTAFQNQSSGNFASFGQLDDAPNLGLSISGLGQIGLPLTAFEADRMIARSELAPFGQMDKTIVDPAVRHTWQIDSSEIRFLNPAWTTYLHITLLRRVGTELGVALEAIDARLHKLLLYGEGGHFKTHQDTEKEARMFGTLIIILPSLHTGGQVRVSRGPQKLDFDTATNSAFGTSYTCLYTDVFHKVHRVTSGYRLALSYNLVLKAPSISIPRAPVANRNMLQIRAMFVAWLNRMKKGMDSPKHVPDFIAHILDHRYSKFGLSFLGMKGTDRSKVAFLKAMAQEVGFKIYLAQFDIQVHGMGIALDVGYGCGRGGGRYGGSPDDSMDFECEHTRTYTLKSAISPDGVELNLEELEVQENDTSPPFNLDEWNIDMKECQGYQGNYAGDVDHYYYRTVVLLWPKERELVMSIRGGGSQYAAERLQRDLERFVHMGAAASDRDRLALEKTGFAVRPDPTCTPIIARAAIALENRDLWAVVNSSVHWQQVAEELWVDAVHKFGWGFVCVMLEAALKLDTPLGELDLLSDTPTDTTATTLPARCTIILNLRKTVGDETIAAKWIDHQVDRLLKVMPIPTSNVIRLAVLHAKNVGFTHGAAILTSMLNKLRQEVSKPGCPSSPGINTVPLSSPLELLAAVLSAFSNEAEASAWVEHALIEFMSTCETLKHGEATYLARISVIALQSGQPLLLALLIACCREQYTTSYLLSTVQPFVEALRLLLPWASYSLIAEEFADFTLHFLNAGNQTLRKPDPVLPPDHTLPVVGNDVVDRFLASSVHHVLKIPEGFDIRHEVERALVPLTRQQKIVTETIKDTGRRPNILIVRKSRPLPPMTICLRNFLKDETKQEWTNASTTCTPSCNTCQALKACLTWLDADNAAAKFFAAFGQAALNWYQTRSGVSIPYRGQVSLAIAGDGVFDLAQSRKSLISGSGGLQAPGSSSGTTGQKRKAIDVIDLTEDDPTTKVPKP